MSTIELGEPRRYTPGEAPLRPMARRFAVRRRAVPAAAVAAIVLAVTGGASGVQADLSQLKVRGLAPIADAGLVVTARGWVFWEFRRDQSLLAAPVGEPVAWTFRAGRPIGGVSVVGEIVEVVLPETAGTEVGQVAEGLVVGLDAATGAQRWRQAGDVLGLPGTPLTILQSGSMLRGVDRATGREVWHSPGATPNVIPLVGTRAGLTFWRWDAESSVARATLLDAHTGVVREVPIALAGNVMPLAVFDEPLTVLYHREAGRGLETYAARVDGDQAVPRLSGEEHLRTCGPLLCAIGDAWVRALGPDGRTVWGRGVALWLNSRIVTLPGGVETMLLALGRTPSALKALVDPRNGEVTVDLGAWLPLGVHNGRMLTIQESPEAGRPAWLGVVEGRSVRTLRPLGTALGCQVADGWLVCRDLRPSGPAGGQPVSAALPLAELLR